MLDPAPPIASRRERDAVFLLAMLVLAASLPSFMTIPFSGPWPLDFQNLWAFHDCAARNDPYAATGLTCRDALFREMRYPPLLYWSFAWTRLLTFAAAGHVWTVFIAIGTVAATLAWIPRTAWSDGGAARHALFASLLVVQFPLMFALERGNNDVIVLVLWTLAAFTFSTGRVGASGAIAGLAAAMKLYPVFACGIIGAGILGSAVRRPAMRPRALVFAGAGVIASALGLAIVFPQSLVFLTKVLPSYAGYPTGMSHFGHQLHNLWPYWNGWALALPILIAWIVAAVLVFDRDQVLLFAGSLAISTFFASTSLDYNLITAYPLLVVLFSRSMGGPRIAAILLLLGVVAIVGHRAAFAWSEAAMRVHIALQWAFLVGTGAAAPWIALPNKPSAGDATESASAPVSLTV